MNHVCAIGTSIETGTMYKCLALRRKKALWCNRRTRNVIENGRYSFPDDCERVAETLRRIGDKWSVLIIVLVELGPRRFNDLKRSIPGISQRMLTLTLRNLERDGLVKRTVTPSIPPFVSYDLTPLGHSLAEPVPCAPGRKPMSRQSTLRQKHFPGMGLRAT
jgi:DNA-binding HxlR family transcriptional regulator